MNDIIQQYLRNHDKRDHEDSFEFYKGLKKEFMSSNLSPKKKRHEKFCEIKQIQNDFHEYVSVLIKTINENATTLKRINKEGHNKNNHQSRGILKELEKIGSSVFEREKTINYNTNSLLDSLPFGNSKEESLSKKEIQSLKNDNVPLLPSIFSDDLVLPQEALFQLIESLIALCRDTMRTCLIQQQIHDISFEQDFELQARNEILLIKNLINEKMSEIKEELNMSNSMINEISTSQIEQNFKQEDNQSIIEKKIENRNKAEETKALKPKVCLDIIEDVLLKGGTKNKDIPYASIKKKLSKWNTYIRTNGEKGSPPLAGYDYYVRQTPGTFKSWVQDTFMPDYRESVRKRKYDAMSIAVYNHPAIYGSEKDEDEDEKED